MTPDGVWWYRPDLALWYDCRHEAYYTYDAAQADYVTVNRERATHALSSGESLAPAAAGADGGSGGAGGSADGGGGAGPASADAAAAARRRRRRAPPRRRRPRRRRRRRPRRRQRRPRRRRRRPAARRRRPHRRPTRPRTWWPTRSNFTPSRGKGRRTPRRTGARSRLHTHTPPPPNASRRAIPGFKGSSRACGWGSSAPPSASSTATAACSPPNTRRST